MMNPFTNNIFDVLFYFFNIKEDQQLIYLYEELSRRKHKQGLWNEIAKQMEGRTAENAYNVGCILTLL